MNVLNPVLIRLVFVIRHAHVETKSDAASEEDVSCGGGCSRIDIIRRLTQSLVSFDFELRRI